MKTAQALADLQRGSPRQASAKHFCTIFQEEMSALYSLAFLLTADRPSAERCFLAALEECRNTKSVFLDWARSWSRRAIIQQAIRQVRPLPETQANANLALAAGERDDIPRRLLQLRPFDRFVFAMAVLERYSIKECAALLDCTARDVEQARIAALQFLGETTDRLIPIFASSREPAAIAQMSAKTFSAA